MLNAGPFTIMIYIRGWIFHDIRVLSFSLQTARKPRKKNHYVGSFYELCNAHITSGTWNDQEFSWPHPPDGMFVHDAPPLPIAVYKFCIPRTNHDLATVSPPPLQLILNSPTYLITVRNAKEMASAVTEMLTSFVSRSSRTWLCFILSFVIAGFAKMKRPVFWNLEIHWTIFFSLQGSWPRVRNPRRHH